MTVGLALGSDLLHHTRTDNSLNHSFVPPIKSVSERFIVANVIKYKQRHLIHIMN